MKTNDERRFTFIPQKKWKNLSEDERKTLGSYKSYYGHYIKVEDEINRFENEIVKLKDKKSTYLGKMKSLNYKIDYLRNDYNYSWSISKIKKKNYYNFTISRRGYPTKTGGLGSEKIIMEHLNTFYKRKKKRLEELFGEYLFYNFHILETGSDKDDVLAEFHGTNLWWVEDKWTNALAGLKFGLKVLFINHPYNQEYKHPDITRVNNWQDIHKIVTGKK